MSTTTPSPWDDLTIPPHARKRGITLNLYDQLSAYVPQRPGAYLRISSDRFGLEAGVERQNDDAEDTRARLGWAPFAKVYLIDNVAYGLELAGRGKKERLRIAADLLALTGLKGFEGFYPDQLSAGMKQRFIIARALAADPDILLLDKPFSGLDGQTRESMRAERLKIWEVVRARKAPGDEQ
ncbi:ATP-binding cassette domain-containing protein [Streptomyces sp. NBC_00448]|uniref:ATP-binding cassette domain-containing protein n=1 Tax=Streptomyces sp. NBC_00448 TaxID=2903652 RepID=UPI002E20041E